MGPAYQIKTSWREINMEQSMSKDHGKTVNVEANLVLTEEGNYVSGFVILTQI